VHVLVGVDALQAHTRARVPHLAWGRFVRREPTGQPVRRRQRLRPVSTAPQVGSLAHQLLLRWRRVLFDPYWLRASIYYGCPFTLYVFTLAFRFLSIPLAKGRARLVCP